MMKKIKSWQTILLISVIVLISSVFVCISLDDLTKCRFIYGKNICNFYAMMDIANHNPSISDFDKMMDLCRDMSDVPKKEGCFEYIAQTFAQIDMDKAKEACDEIKGFDGVYSKDDCYSRIYLQSTKIEHTKTFIVGKFPE